MVSTFSRVWITRGPLYRLMKYSPVLHGRGEHERQRLALIGRSNHPPVCHGAFITYYWRLCNIIILLFPHISPISRARGHRRRLPFPYHRFLSFFSFISLIADGPHHYHPACGHKGSSHLSPVHALQFFYRDASSALLQLVNQWLNFTYSRYHAFRYERKNTNPTLVRIELTTSVLADVQLTY